MPFRKISDLYGISPPSAYAKAFALAQSLPHCADVTRLYCSRFSGILVFDGKFVKVRQYQHKIPFLYGIDYLSHDIPTFRLAHAESYIACVKYFQSLRLLNYPLQIVVSDDNENIRLACKYVYPNANFQLCQNHFKENIRRSLCVRTDPTYRDFMYRVDHLFSIKRSLDDFNRCATSIFNDYHNNPVCVSVMLDIQRKTDILLGYLKVKHTPRTTNLIESFNSHFQGRFKSTKGFETFKSADVWINAYILRRRFKEFTDCTAKFRHLNGTSSIQQSKKSDVDLTSFLEFLGANF